MLIHWLTVSKKSAFAVVANILGGDWKVQNMRFLFRHASVISIITLCISITTVCAILHAQDDDLTLMIYADMHVVPHDLETPRELSALDNIEFFDYANSDEFLYCALGEYFTPRYFDNPGAGNWPVAISLPSDHIQRIDYPPKSSAIS